MEKMIDIIPFLAGIVEKNTATHQSDFLLDRKILQGATWQPHQESRTFLWMSRPCGTNCVLEAEVFQRETDAHIVWTHYEYDADRIKAYRVIVAPERAAGLVLGKVQPLNYKEQVQRVKQKALHVQSVKLQFEDGEQYNLSHEDYKRQIHGLIDVHGRVETICFVPENEHELFCTLQTERAISTRKKKSPHKKKPPTR